MSPAILFVEDKIIIAADITNKLRRRSSRDSPQVAAIIVPDGHTPVGCNGLHHCSGYNPEEGVH